jgi:HPt (histidine-containing phosphotransfer) domain-containing protein
VITAGAARVLDLSKPEFRAVLERFMTRLAEMRERLGQLEDMIGIDGDDALAETRRLAHRLSGSAGTFGFASLGAEASEMERLLIADPRDRDSLRAQLRRLLAAIDQCHEMPER